jgi:hypothetical protein
LGSLSLLATVEPSTEDIMTAYSAPNDKQDMLSTKRKHDDETGGKVESQSHMGAVLSD